MACESKNNRAQGRPAFPPPAAACAAACAVALSLLVGAAGAAPYELRGSVVGVHDGDTITLLDASKVQHKVRLAEIDAPELKQAHGQDAKQALSKMVFGKSVVVNVANRDRYGREVGNVLVNGVDVNGSMVRYGYAFCYRAYKHRPEVEKYEDEARESKRGVWADKSRVYPWDYRKKKR